MEIEAIAKEIINRSIKVHSALGPGLLESVYQKCLNYELEKAGINTRCEVLLPVQYDGIQIDAGFRSDMIVENVIIIENKTVEMILPIHEAQLLIYLKIANMKLGFILNWNVKLMKNGIKRMVNNL